MFNGRKRLLVTVLAIGMLSVNVSTAFANEVGPGYENISVQSEGSKGTIRSEADITRIEEDGI